MPLAPADFQSFNHRAAVFQRRPSAVLPMNGLRGDFRGSQILPQAQSDVQSGVAFGGTI
jgi:hypothetical protein